MSINGNITVVSIEDSANAGTYLVLGGIDSTAITHGGEPIETTNTSTGGNTTYADFEGAKQVTVAGNMILDSTAAHVEYQKHMDNGGTVNYKIERHDGKTCTAGFVRAKPSTAAPHNNVTTATISIMSNGAATFA